VSRVHRRGAEDAEGALRLVFLCESLRTQRLCGESPLLYIQVIIAIETLFFPPKAASTARPLLTILRCPFDCYESAFSRDETDETYASLPRRIEMSSTFY
jgi:hypothetical protein